MADQKQTPKQNPPEVDITDGAQASPQVGKDQTGDQTGHQVATDTPGSDERLINATGVDPNLTTQLHDKSNDELLDAILNVPEDRLIPWEEVPLPSRGLYYDGRVPGGVVRIKAMGTHADKILATARLAQTGQSIDYLLDHCVQLPDKFPAAELLAGDRTFLLYTLRGITHGNIYEFMIECPNCEAVQNCSYDLNQLANTLILGKPEIDEPSKVILPYLSQVTGKKVWVHVRFLRGKDVSILAQRQRFNKRIAGPQIRSGSKPAPTGKEKGQPRLRPVVIDDTLTENLNLIITSFMGVDKDPVKIKGLVSRLHSSDTAAIREFLKKNSPGIDTTIQVTCSDCNTEFRTELPIKESFFRPADGGGVRP